MEARPDASAADEVWFVYDGDCPICQLGASMYKVRQSAGILHTVDARTEADHPVMREVNLAGLNLDEGMVIKYQGALYHGEAALQIMAQLGADVGVFNRLNTALFKSKTVARKSYPLMRAARDVLLKLRGVKKIGNLDGRDG